MKYSFALGGQPPGAPSLRGWSILIVRVTFNHFHGPGGGGTRVVSLLEMST